MRNHTSIWQQFESPAKCLILHNNEEKPGKRGKGLGVRSVLIDSFLELQLLREGLLELRVQCNQKRDLFDNIIEVDTGILINGLDLLRHLFQHEHCIIELMAFKQLVQREGNIPNFLSLNYL